MAIRLRKWQPASPSVRRRREAGVYHNFFDRKSGASEVSRFRTKTVFRLEIQRDLGIASTKKADNESV
jgi:hypothetical protein